MGGKRIIVDHQHALRQHKAFAVIVIALLLVVVAVWFIQIRLMVRNVDFSKLQQGVADAQSSLQGAFETQDNGLNESAGAAAAVVTDAVADAQAAIETDEQIRAEVAARAAAALEDQVTPTDQTAPSTTDEATITE